MDTLRHASCSCGSLAIDCRGEPVRVSICHCLECQKRTGSIYGVQARFPAENVTVSGASTVFSRTGDSGSTAQFHFCPVCSSIVYWVVDRLPGFVVVAVGAFADPSFPVPVVSVYEARSHAWALPALELDHQD